jgi:ferredoxin-NADP reductase/ferredoxin
VRPADDAENPPRGASAHTVTLRFEDGVERAISVAPGEFILDAALRQGVPLVHQCRSGSCSTCIAQVLGGDVVMAAERSTSLMAAEVAEKKRLLCSAYALRDSTIGLHYPASLIDETTPRVIAGEVRHVDWPASTVAKLEVELEDGSRFGFRSGQYVRLRVPGTDQWRSYSMASTARDLPRLDFLVRIIPGGAMSEYLRSRCRAGNEIEIEGPMGAFILHPSQTLHLFVAGGSGLAPILSMIDEIRRRPGRRPPMLLSFGCNSERQFFYREEVELRAWWMPELRVVLSADEVDDPSSGLLRGTPVATLHDDCVTDRDAAAYLCGPRAMIEAARARLLDLGVKPQHIYAEQFVASAIG